MPDDGGLAGLATVPLDALPDDHPYFVHAQASLQEQRPRTLKHGDTFGVFDANGDVLLLPGCSEGLYHRDTRHLSHLSLTLGQKRPLLLGSSLKNDNAVLTCDLTNPDLADGERVALEQDLIHIRRSRFLWRASCFERIAVRNFSGEAVQFDLTIGFGADFADLFEVRGQRRKARGTLEAAQVVGDRVTLGYTGLDGVLRATHLRFEPMPERLDSALAVFSIALAPKEQTTIFFEIHCGAVAPKSLPSAAFRAGIRSAHRALRMSSRRGAAIIATNDVFNETIRRSVSDLRMLVTDKAEGPYPYAGIPWFSTVFGRDALITAMQTLWFDPHIARGVLRHLAANQAEEEIPEADAEPGKILHEIRYGEMALLGEVPFRRYYGSVDSTPLFVMLAGLYFDRTHDLETLHGLWPHIVRALEWVSTFGDLDGDGFVEYARKSDLGLLNQGWKDSHDSVFHRDGTLAAGPIAIAEVQAYVFAAWQGASRIADALGKETEAARYADRARTMRDRFAEQFFDPALGSYVLALDGDKRPCRVLTSNAGHVLFAGLAAPEHAAITAQTLMSSRSFSGWGVRTLASSEARYNPMSYHNGSIWPHDNAIVAAGLARYGYREEAARIFSGVFAVSLYTDLRRLPELFCGFPRQRNQGPTFYPVACSPQAWAATAPISLIQSCLGLTFDPADRRILFDCPQLPDFLDGIRLLGLTLGEARVDVVLTRAGTEVAVRVEERTGDIQVVTTN